MDDNNKPIKLDDVQRVKVLSPGMMVYKRFIRNKLAVTGMVILVIMFLFSFLGGFLYPYKQSQVFKGTGTLPLDYAVADYNKELRFTDADGQTFLPAARAQFLLAISNGKDSYTSGSVEYIIEKYSDNFYRIGGYVPVVEVEILRDKYSFGESEGLDLTDELKEAFKEAYKGQKDSFTYNGETYAVLRENRWGAIAVYRDFAVASLCVLDAYDQSEINTVRSYHFRLAAETAMIDQDTSFTFDGNEYKLEMLDDLNGTVYKADGTPYAEISDILVTTPPANPIFLPVSYIKEIREAIISNAPFFITDTATGVEARYDVFVIGGAFYIKTEMPTEIIYITYPPSKDHILGTDENGMDILARLMYGGRISLTVGFVVIFIEIFIGVIIGGISGYFSGWVDTLLMRFVDLFNTIPYLPMLIIIGSIFDANRIDPTKRIYFLMLILGLMGWTGIARVVRGQILSLREQDYMIAAEASGLSVPRRIFKHLVPNVMPLLIVNATMGLGGIILTEATLSFLGMGIKYPLASWGSMANAANSVVVMTYYPWTWIPPGIMIFTTVLGFNFVGDGLRDAFDPKMKR